MAKRKPARLVAYTCGICGKPAEAAEGTALHLLQLCDPCQAKRYAKGLKAQQEAARG